ncbi:MAG TPA: hypothetical protein VII72_21860 [Myxococcota bacterium]
MPEVARATLVGKWTHSHEEDSPDERVYRRSSYAFPRSRGRESFELQKDGKLVERAIGPTDRMVSSEGSWELRDDGCLVLRAGTGRGERELAVLSADADRLVVKRR